MKKAILFIFLICSTLSYAKEHRERLTINHTPGEKIDIFLVSYLNERQTLEVRIEGSYFDDGLKSLNPVLGYGRDLDSNGKIDTWFILDINLGVKVIELEGRKKLGQDILGKKILLNDKVDSFYIRSVVAGIFRHLFMSIDSGYESHFEYYKRTLDLEEFRIRLREDGAREIPTLSPEQSQWAYFLLFEGYKSSYNDLNEALGKDYKWLASIDTVLWGAGGYFFKWGLSGFNVVKSSMVNVLNKTSSYRYFRKFGNSKLKYLKTQNSMAINKMKSFNVSKPMAKVVMTKALLKSSTDAAMHSLSLKHKITHKVLKTLGKAGAAGASKWKYIALTGSATVLSETVNNYSRLHVEKDPAQTAKNVLSDPDIMNNVQYMLMQNFLSTAASTTVETTKKQFAVCGFVAVAHSGVRNFIFTNNSDFRRVGLDASWEVVVGTSQTLVDLKAISYFEKLALKKNSPKLQLIGYAIVFVEQSLMGYVYSNATGSLKASKASPKPEDLAVFPVFVSE